MKKILCLLSLSLLLVNPGTLRAQDEGDDSGSDAGDSLIETAQSLLGSKMDEKCGECDENVEACVNKQVKAITKLIPAKLLKACGVSKGDLGLSDLAQDFVDSCSDDGSDEDSGDGEDGEGAGGGEGNGPGALPPPGGFH